MGDAAEAMAENVNALVRRTQEVHEHALAVRAEAMFALEAKGWTRARIADAFGLSTGRVTQIMGPHG